MKAVIIVQGFVQGIGYRFFTVEQAKRYKVKGYVRNLPDGGVEVIAEGDEGLLKDFIRALKIGPASAHVTGIDVKWSDTEFGFTDFDIRY
jgi:acylphosphatase